MSSDVTIEIFGRVAIGSAEAIQDLAVQAADEGTLDWSEPLNDDEFVDLLTAAAAERRAVLLTRSDTGNFFEGVTSACQRAGLSYVVSVGPTGEDGYTDGFSWAPGMEEEFHFEISGDNPSIKISEVRTLLAQGGDALQKRLDELETRTQAAAVEIEPGFIEAFAAFTAERPGL